MEECMDKKCKSYSKGTFSCIDSVHAVYPQRGDKRVWHFSHYSSKQNQACPHSNGGETMEHYNSKHWIAKNIAQIRFRVASCPKCCKSRHLERWDGSYCVCAEVERRIPGTSRVADVLLVEKSVATGYTKVFSAVEVFHTHEVDEEKMAECKRVGVRVFEVASEHVMQDMQRHGEILSDTSVTLSARRVVSELCNSCVMHGSFSDDLDNQVYHWMCYDAEWERFCNAICQARAAAQRAMGRAYIQEIPRMLAYDEWYESSWEQHWLHKSRDLHQETQLKCNMQAAITQKRRAAEEMLQHAFTKRAALEEVRSRE